MELDSFSRLKGRYTGKLGTKHEKREKAYRDKGSWHGIHQGR